MNLKTKIALLVAPASLAVANIASAALDATAVSGIMAGVQTDAQTAFDGVLPVVGVVLGLVIGLSLLKKFAYKVS